MTDKKSDALKITNQFRSRTGFVYDLKYEGSRLTLTIVQRERPDDPGEWSVEARASSLPDVVPIVAWGATRRDALGEVGRAWASSAATTGLPSFDWDAIAAVLSDVRAL
jgi:hypothetical protein